MFSMKTWSQIADKDLKLPLNVFEELLFHGDKLFGLYVSPWWYLEIGEVYVSFVIWFVYGQMNVDARFIYVSDIYHPGRI